MKKIDRAERDLWKVFDSKKGYSDKVFLKNISDWVIKYFGNVNVAQRLNIMSNEFQAT